MTGMKKLFLFTFFLASYTAIAQESNKTRQQEATECVERGNLKAESGDWKAALNEYNNAVGFDPKNADAYYYRALAAQNLKDYRNAVNDYSRAISLDNSNGNYFYGRGMCFYELGRKNDCCIDLSKASGLGVTDAGTAMMNYCN
jgi:Tfp pilus assembly protein PilF